jgi:hypothetical protein
MPDQDARIDGRQEAGSNEPAIKMANSLESSEFPVSDVAAAQPADWLKVGVVAAGSALAGGLLAAWWYRRTLIKLRLAAEDSQHPDFGIPLENTADED